MKTIRNKFAKKCCVCKVVVGAGDGFAVNKSEKWDTYCRQCVPVQINTPSVRTEVTATGDIYFPYSVEAVALVKSIPSARYNKDGKFWNVQPSSEVLPRLLEVADRLGLTVASELRQNNTQNISKIDNSLNEILGNKSLYPFQRDGVRFLTQQNRRVSGEAVNGTDILAAGKKVVVIGGGDTGSDCIGTSLRQGASSVTQIEIMPAPPEKENKALTWPNWPLKMRTSSSQEEGCHNALEQYELKADGDVAITFSCSKGSFEAEREVSHFTGIIQNPGVNTDWRVKMKVLGFIPIKLPYLVIDLAEDGSYTVIGYPSREYVWIMARTKSLPEETWAGILQRLTPGGQPVMDEGIHRAGLFGRDVGLEIEILDLTSNLASQVGRIKTRDACHAR